MDLRPLFPDVGFGWTDPVIGKLFPDMKVEVSALRFRSQELGESPFRNRKVGVPGSVDENQLEKAGFLLVSGGVEGSGVQWDPSHGYFLRFGKLGLLPHAARG
jgi:hypothetical protein